MDNYTTTKEIERRLAQIEKVDRKLRELDKLLAKKIGELESKITHVENDFKDMKKSILNDLKSE